MLDFVKSLRYIYRVRVWVRFWVLGFGFWGFGGLGVWGFGGLGVWDFGVWGLGVD